MLKGNILPPRCFQVTEIQDEGTASEVWLWLEDIQDGVIDQWSIDDYRQAAFHLGHFNGQYLLKSGRLPLPWLCRQGISSAIEAASPAVALLGQNRDNPLVVQYLPDDDYEIFLTRWQGRRRYYEMLEFSPQTLCHFDAHRGNLFLRKSLGVGSELIAIDWSYVGYGAVGADLFFLMVYSLLADGNPPQMTEALARETFEGYLAGLGKAGWSGDPDLVRLGYTSAAALFRVGGVRFVLGNLLDDDQKARMEQAMGGSITDYIARFHEYEVVFERILVEAEMLYRRLAG